MTDSITPSSSFESKLDLTEKILSNRKTHRTSGSIVGMLLHGDPGTGKTSFMRYLGHLVGAEVIIIEAPHITEEHIINIPFIVFKDANDTGSKDNQAVKNTGATIVLADSHLHSKLTATTKISDAELLKNIYGKKQDIYIKIWESLGGDEHTIPDAIKDFRSHTKTILFIDEFFRQSSARIKNILRGILNGKLGTHDLPADVYVTYASNLNDEGVEPMAANTDFQAYELENPDKDEWFAWLVDKFKDSSEVKLNDQVVAKFYKLLTKQHLSSNDANADVRASPRTWEQILLYVSSSLPAKNEKEAKSLVANIRSKFTHYKTGDEHKIADKVINAVVELIKETSNIDVTPAGNPSSEWRSTLEHQIQQKMKLGKFRTYVPVISGPPGIGKTSEIRQTAEDLDLRYIYIDCSTLDPEMVMGIPVSEKKGSEKIKVAFSFPQLYQQILDDIEKADKLHAGDLSADEKKEYAKQKYKYLIFFDELNRTSVKVFNGLRKVLLEKDFGHGLELPDEAIMVAAINPSDLGTHDLTSHMRDVLDIIDTKPSWKKTEKYIEDLKVDAAPSAITATKNTITKLFSSFKDSEASRPADQRPFFLNVGSSPLYISPREIVTMISNTAIDLDLKLKRIKPEMIGDAKQKDKAFKVIVDCIFSNIKGTLTNAMHKQQLQAPEFIHDLKAWINHNVDVEGIFFKKTKSVALEDILIPYFEHPAKDLTKEIELINYVENNDISIFRDELMSFLAEKLKEGEKHLSDKKHPLRDLKDGKLEHDQTVLVSSIESLLRNIVLTFKVNKVTAEMFDGVKFAMRAALQEMLESFEKSGKNDLTAEALELNSRFRKLVKT